MKKSPEKEQQRNLVEAEGMAVLGGMHGALGTTCEGKPGMHILA